jgi:hypothetical protein
MKIIIGLILLMYYNSYSQSRIGIINDPDGFSNIRQERNVNSKIVTKIQSYRPFEFITHESGWYSVSLNNQAIGFIHKSRINEIKACKCGDEIPGLIVAKNNRLISFCGDVESKGNGMFQIYESEISDCNADQKLVSINRGEKALVKITDDSIKITLLMRLPVGKNFAFIETPFKEWKLDLERSNSKFKVVKVLNTNMTAEQILRLVKSIREVPPKNLDQFYSIMYKLFLSAISGNKEAEQMFRDHKGRFGITLDGFYEEDFGELKYALDDYQKIE